MAAMRACPWRVTSVTTGTGAWGSLGTEMDLGLTWRSAFDLVGGYLVGGSSLKHRRVCRPQCDSPIHLQHRAVVKRGAKEAAGLVREVEAHDRCRQLLL